MLRAAAHFVLLLYIASCAACMSVCSGSLPQQLWQQLPLSALRLHTPSLSTMCVLGLLWFEIVDQACNMLRIFSCCRRARLCGVC